jgi:hypothetical protein
VSGRPGERGYALIIAAVAIFFLALVAAVIAPQLAGGMVSANLEVNQLQAKEIADAGLQWALVTGQTGTKSFGGGQFTVAMNGRQIVSTGTFGASSNPLASACVASTDLTLFYVPGSRYANVNDLVAFEAFNKTGSPVTLTSMVATLSATGFYETVAIKVFSDSGSGAPTVDYGTVWSYTTDGGGTRPGSGTSITFASAPTLPTGRQALIQLTGFKAGAASTTPVDMDLAEARVVFSIASGALAPTIVPRTTP